MTVSRSVLVALAATLAVAACKPGAGPGGASAGPAAPPPDPTEAFLNDPARVQVYDAMERLFPADYARIRGELDAMIKAGKTPAEVQARSFELGHAFGADNVQASMAAPTPVLVRLAEKNRDLLAVLAQQNVEACAQLARNRFESDAGLTPASQAAMDAASAAQVEAIRAGKDTPTPRPNELDEAVLTSLSEALKAQNVREAAMKALFADEAENPPAADVCEGGLGLARVIASMPPEHAARLQAVALEAVMKPKAPKPA